MTLALESANIYNDSSHLYTVYETHYGANLSKVLVVIPARAGSSFQNKNRRPLNGRPLYSYTLDSSEIKLPHDTVVTSDDRYIIADASERGYITHRRSKSLANSKATLDQVTCAMAKEYPDYDHYICLAPTSPLRTAKHVNEAIDLHLSTRADATVSVKEELKSIWSFDRGQFARPIVERLRNRQECRPVYICNGAIFISSHETITKQRRRAAGHVSLYTMSDESSLDVHNQDDIDLAEHYINRRLNGN